jgi:TonB-dependent SusC/RagA subfamily outer membrane receptor
MTCHRLRQLAAGALTAATLTACSHAGASSGPRGEITPGARTAERADDDAATLSIEDFIQRQVPGVSIYRSGSTLTVQIRGQGTLGIATNALVVIDGVPQDSPSSLLGISPSEIQKVEVLKDAAASQYGVRAANGVLVVTLRRSS